jgi:ATP-dependent Lhr-like helicase
LPFVGASKLLIHDNQQDQNFLLLKNQRHSARIYFDTWYSFQQWQAFDFQSEMMDAIDQGYNGLLNAPTGSGKTYAVWIPLLSRLMSRIPEPSSRGLGLRFIWLTPLRALARDIRDAMQEACDRFDYPIRVETRTGDTPSSQKQAQVKNMPEVLVTTPESLHILLARKSSGKLLGKLDAVIVDEWHELIGSKRGVQVELALSRLRSLNPELMTWGISATIGNLVQAFSVSGGSMCIGQIRCRV